MSDDLLEFIEEDSPSQSDLSYKIPRKILIVDDDEDMHAVTKLSLKGLSFDNCIIELIHAYSGHEAYRILQEQPDIAVVLLDVVMESDFAGLELVRKIRKELQFEKLRIILRTGQPGYAPEIETIEQYDINDYRSKTELTRERLYGCFMTALRSYEQLEKLEVLAYIDPLTNLYNRNGLLRLLDYYNDNEDKNYTLVIVDLQQFSALINNFGPLHGDKYLKAFASKLASFFEIKIQTRLWADNFAFLVPTEEVKIQELLKKLKGSLIINDITHPVNFCTGMTVLDKKISPAELIAHTTIALKKAKQAGVNQCVTFTEVMVKILRERAAMLSSLQQDFQEDRLFLVYQPQVHVHTNQVIGIEALVRWQDSSGHMVSPEIFIELAENSGLILTLGEWILRKALNESKPFFTIYPHLRVGVNVSAIQFHKEDFVTIVQDALTEQGVSGNNLNLEITESVGILGSEEIEKKINDLKLLGITISIDDFGTGFSNLSYLENLSADCLKIDRSFVNKLNSNSGRHIIEMIVNLGRNLGMNVIAEGVETKEQQKKLIDMGCYESQGYLYSHPLSIRQLHRWIKETLK